MSRCRQAFAGHRLRRLHGSFLTRSAPQPTTARRPRRPRKPDRPSAARSSHAPGRSYPSSRTTKTPPMLSLGRRRRAQIRTQSLSEPRTGTESPPRHQTNHRRVCRLGRLHGSFLARSAPQPTIRRPCASPSPSLRSTSASAWAAESTQTTKQRLPHWPSPYRSAAAPAPSGLMPAALNSPADQTRPPADMHDRDSPQEQKLMRRPMPQTPRFHQRGFGEKSLFAPRAERCQRRCRGGRSHPA